MRRDLEVFRGILSKCEASDREDFTLYLQWPGDLVDEKDTKWSEEELFHLNLMRDAGLVAFQRMHDTYGEGFSFGMEFRLTNSGHDFLDAIRDEGLWAKTKDAVAETGGNASVEIIKGLAAGFLKKKISKHTGIEI